MNLGVTSDYCRIYENEEHFSSTTLRKAFIRSSSEDGYELNNFLKAVKKLMIL